MHFRIGDSYDIIDHGRKVRGYILDIKSSGYLVQWEDGLVTIEDKPDPAIKTTGGENE